MAIVWKAPISKTSELLDLSGKRELFWYGVTIGQIGFGILSSEKRQPTPREVDSASTCSWQCNGRAQEICSMCSQYKPRITVMSELWHADQDEDMVRIHREHFQVIKAPKKDTPYAEYWPGKKTLQWILDALNEYEKTHPLEHSVNE